MNLCDVKTVRALMDEFGLSFNKSFGQNFLIDASVPERIAEFSAESGADCVLEIGAGVGSLTSCLSDLYPEVTSVEIDRGLVRLLEYTLKDRNNIRIVNNDILKTDISTLFPEDKTVAVCANLPYYITTPIIMALLESGRHFESITVMVQKEVASRLAAKPGSADYGAITVSLAYYGEVEKLMSVPHHCFCPAPKVDSAVVRITPYKEKKYSPLSEDIFRRCVRGAFDMRRKTLSNALSSAFSELGKENVINAIRSADISPEIRGERLSCEEFVRIADEICKLKNKA